MPWLPGLPARTGTIGRVTAGTTSARIGGVIRNVVIHVTNEQPLIADLFGMPASTDAGLVCTNLHMSDGKRPVFIDSSAATFFFPYLVIRFLEIPAGALARHLEEVGDAPASMTPGAGEDERLPIPVESAGAQAHDAGDELDVELDIDEDFLQRVRDI